ncbi:MAG: amino acid carrier protein, partial [Nitrospirae bacterium]
VELSGIILLLATVLVIIGGIKSIAKVTEFLVPFMILFYMGGSIFVLMRNIAFLDDIFLMVIHSAFTPLSLSGGIIGATVKDAIRWGVSRGVFSNESGLGSSSIAAAACCCKDPVSQALVSMSQTFIDTIVVCTMTGFVILTSGVWKGTETGAALTAEAFSKGMPGDWGGIIVALSLICFAYSTILGWSYYGEKSVEYLFGESVVKPYRLIFCLFVAVGAVIKLELVWSISDVFNAFMAMPNLIGLLLLSKEVSYETKKYFYREI